MLSEKISPENRTKWNNFKEKASDVNEKMTEMYKPIDNVVRAMMASIG
jgi:RNA-splicing ligase RtcB